MAETLGGLLRRKREALALSVADVEKQIHIRATHLQAIEADDLTAFPSVPQARGFIRNYAAFLGVSEEDIRNQTGATRPRPAAPVAVSAPASESAPAGPAVVAQPETAHAAPPDTQATVPASSARTVSMSRTAPNSWQNSMPRAVKPGALKRWLSGELLLGIIAGVVVVGLFAWGVYYLVQAYLAPQPEGTSAPLIGLIESDTPTSEQPAPEGTPSLEVTAGVAPVETSAGFTPMAVTLPPTAYPTPLGGIYTTVHIRIEVLLNAFLVVEIDGKEQFRDRVRPGRVLEYDGAQLVHLGTGNGAAIRVIYNGVDQGLLGDLGAVVWRSWNLAGPVAPTAAPSATPPAATPSPTPGG